MMKIAKERVPSLSTFFSAHAAPRLGGPLALRATWLLLVATLATAALLPAQVTIRLSATTSPAAAQPGLTYVNVTGSNFPAGVISPSSVTIHVTSVGSTVTTTAVAVTTIFGTVRRVTFQVPPAVVVAAPSDYAVWISGVTSSGTSFSSGNTAALIIDPPPSITVVNPVTGQPGQSISVTITGLYTNFVQAGTMANFGPGISVGGAAEGGAFGPVTVNSPTSATAKIVIDSSVAAGVHDITVATGSQRESAQAGFLVYRVAETNQDGTASFPADGITLLVKDVGSLQPLSGITAALLNNGTKDGFWVYDPLGRYLPAFTDPPASSQSTIYLQPLGPPFITLTPAELSKFGSWLTADDTVSEDSVEQVYVQLGQAALQAVLQLLETGACAVPGGSTAVTAVQTAQEQIQSLPECSDSDDQQACAAAVSKIISSTTNTLVSSISSGLFSGSCETTLLNNLPSEVPTVVGAADDIAKVGLKGAGEDGITFFLPYLANAAETGGLYADGYRCFLVFQPNPNVIAPIQNTIAPFLVEGYSKDSCSSAPIPLNYLVAAKVSGTVEDAATGIGIPGARVYAEQGTAAGGFSVTTASDGTFSADVGGFQGNFEIVAQAQGYISNSVEIAVQQNDQSVSPIVLSLTLYRSGQPLIKSVTPILANSTQTIIITGSGFGNTSPQTAPLGDGSVDTLACNVTTPSLAIIDHDVSVGPPPPSSSWSAGQQTCSNSDLIGIRIVSWTDGQIVLSGFGSALGESFSINPGDSLTVELFGPNNSGVATYNLQVPPFIPISPSGATTVQVVANQPFTDTGISLTTGESVTITASGLISLTTDGHIPSMSPAGFPPNCTAGEVFGRLNLSAFPDPQLPCWSLIGRIGTTGQIFEVGTGTVFQAQASGELYLGINDNFLPDNSGSWSAAITVTQ